MNRTASRVGDPFVAFHEKALVADRVTDGRGGGDMMCKTAGTSPAGN